MRCRIKKIIYLKESERTDKQQKKLEHHLKKCPSCKMMIEELNQHPSLLSSIKEEPVLKNPGALTNDIIRSIRRSKYELHHSKVPERTLLDFMTSRSVRFALGTMFLILVALFSVQEAKIVKQLHHLERRMARQSSSSLTVEGSHFNVRQQINKLNSDIDKDHIVIDTEALESLLQSYDKLKIENKLLLKLLEEKSLTTAGVTLEDGLTRDELRTLVNNEDLLREFYNL
jgi:hypothetical protein